MNIFSCSLCPLSSNVSLRLVLLIVLLGATGGIDCVSYGAAYAYDFDFDGFDDLAIIGDTTGASGAALNGAPSSVSTTIYRNNRNQGFVRQQSLRGMRQGGIVSIVETPRKKREKRLAAPGSPYQDLVISGVQLTNSVPEFVTYRFFTTSEQSATTTVAATTQQLATTNAQSA